MARYITIQNKAKALPKPARIKFCRSFFCRLRGFTFRKELAQDEGLLLVQAKDSRMDSSIHMLAVWTDLAVFWINADLMVVDKVLAKSWRLAYFPAKPAKYVLEIHPDRMDDYQIGDKVEFIDE
jgi:uncharacterized membrane protein (UPF0127 family)